jgi:hypothetical protein
MDGSYAVVYKDWQYIEDVNTAKTYPFMGNLDACQILDIDLFFLYLLITLNLNVMRIKNRITLSILILSLTGSITIVAQSKQEPQYFSGPQYLNDFKDSILLDSIVRYKYYNHTDSLPIAKTAFQYDGSGRKIDQHEKSGAFEDYWKDSVKYEFTYDGNGHLISEIRSVIKSDTLWIYDYKDLWRYDANGNLTLQEEYIWDHYSNQWIGKTGRVKLEFTYDDQNNQTSKTLSWWDYDENKWAGRSKEEDQYDASGNIIIHKDLNYSDQKGWWISGLIIYDFDEAGNMILREVHKYDYTSGSLQPWYKFEYSYDDRGNETLSVQYDWDVSSIAWEESIRRKRTYSYDSIGHLLSWTSFHYWNNTWEPSSKQDFQYDSHGNLTLDAWYIWQPHLSIWTGSEKEEWLYDENDSLISWSHFDWDGYTDKWIRGDFNRRYFYDEDYNHLILLEYRAIYEAVPSGMGHEVKYIKHDWYHKHEYYYDQAGRDTLYKWSESGDSTDIENWECQPKRYKAYDDNGYLTLLTEVGSSRMEFKYNEFGTQLMASEYDWVAGEWLGIMRWEDTYDENDLKLIHADFHWDPGSKSWMIAEKAFYYWSEHILTSRYNVRSQSLLVYPNPTDGLLLIELPGPENYSLDVYTTDGKKVYAARINNGESSIDLSELNPGLYFLILQNEKDIYFNRIIIK